MKYVRICEQCGREFIAQKQTTRFCSTYCSSRARKNRLREERRLSVSSANDIKEHERLRNKEVLSPSMAAVFLGVNRATVYRYINQGIIRTARTPGKTLILREDLDILFSTEKLMLPTESQSRYVTLGEASAMSGLTLSGCYKFLKKSGLRSVRKGKLFYYDREKVEKAIVAREQNLHPEIDDWYTREEVITIYGLKDSAITRMVRDYAIPWKRIKNVYYYSKGHVDAVRRAPVIPVKEDYYSVQDAMEKYSLTRHMVYHHLKLKKIKRIQVGAYVYFRKKDFDAIFSVPEFDL